VPPGVVDVDFGRPHTRQQQVASPQSLGMVPGVRECAAARVPAEVVEFVSPGQQVGPADDLSVPGRLRVSAEHGQRVRLLRRAKAPQNVPCQTPFRPLEGTCFAEDSLRLHSATASASAEPSAGAFPDQTSYQSPYRPKQAGPSVRTTRAERP
jgi:hypothetical protein